MDHFISLIDLESIGLKAINPFMLPTGGLFVAVHGKTQYGIGQRFPVYEVAELNFIRLHDRTVFTPDPEGPNRYYEVPRGMTSGATRYIDGVPWHLQKVREDMVDIGRTSYDDPTKGETVLESRDMTLKGWLALPKQPEPPKRIT